MGRRRRVNPRRKKWFFVGLALLGVGLIVLLSTLFPLLGRLDMVEILDHLWQHVARVLAGLFLMAVGMFLLPFGARALGVPDAYHLDPPPHREEELEGWLQEQGVDTSGRPPDDDVPEIVKRLRERQRRAGS